MRKIERISISAADRERLERLVRDRNTPQKVVWRARIVLLASDGLRAEAIAATVGKSLLTVRRWRRRYVAKGVDGLLKDATRPSRVKPLSPDKIKQVVHMTLHEKPPNATHWSVRSMAAVAGVSYSSVQRIWRAHGLKPHLIETFKVSRDKNFAAKVEDVVGLYLNPPDKALVLCVDEKSQIQALDRTQPGLPMKKGRAGTMTHDYKRNGTTTLFAALNRLDGTVIGAGMPRHRHREFLRFLKLIDQQTPAGLDLHLIVDNYACTHNRSKCGGPTMFLRRASRGPRAPNLARGRPNRGYDGRRDRRRNDLRLDGADRGRLAYVDARGGVIDCGARLRLCAPAREQPAVLLRNGQGRRSRRIRERDHSRAGSAHDRIRERHAHHPSRRDRL